MSKALSDPASKEIIVAPEAVKSATPDELVEYVNTAHSIVLAAQHNAVLRGVDMGNLLIAVKEKLPSGKFCNWVTNNTQVGTRHAQRCMKLARRYKELSNAEATRVSHLSLRRAMIEMNNNTSEAMKLDKQDRIKVLNTALDKETTIQKAIVGEGMPNPKYKPPPCEPSTTPGPGEALVTEVGPFNRLDPSDPEGCVAALVAEVPTNAMRTIAVGVLDRIGDEGNPFDGITLDDPDDSAAAMVNDEDPEQLRAFASGIITRLDTREQQVVEDVDGEWEEVTDELAGRLRASDALHFATIAISQLSRIRADDPKRAEALAEVRLWIDDNPEGGAA